MVLLLVWLVFNFFEDAEEANNEVAAIGNDANPYETDQNKLIITYSIACTPFEPREIAWRPRDFVVPRGSGGRGTGYERSKIVVEAEGERSRPSANKENFR